MKWNLKFEVIYPEPVEKVWRALTDPQAIEQWLMQNNFQPRVGHRFQFRVESGPGGWPGIVDGEILEADPPRRLVYSWCGRSGLDTVVAWTLEAVDEGTRVRLEHTGFRGLRGWMIKRELAKGWGSKILTHSIPMLLTYWSGEGPVPDISEFQ
jgi:uncharacterized protein YndB with AHSA1/START domain